MSQRTTRTTARIMSTALAGLAVFTLTACGGAQDAAQSVLDKAEQEGMVVAVQMFDRELRSAAAMGDVVSNNPNDANPRKASLLVMMAERGSLLSDMTVTAKGADGQPVDVWQDGAVKAGVEALDPVMDQVQFTRGAVSACLTISEVANEASDVTLGECKW